MPKPAQRYLSFIILLGLASLSSLFFVQKAEAAWSFDALSPRVRAQINCANNQTIFYDVLGRGIILFGNSDGSSSAECDPFPGSIYGASVDFLTYQLWCWDITKCESLEYQVFKCLDEACNAQQLLVDRSCADNSSPPPLDCPEKVTIEEFDPAFVYEYDPQRREYLYRYLLRDPIPLPVNNAFGFKIVLDAARDRSGNISLTDDKKIVCNPLSLNSACVTIPGEIDVNVIIDVNRNSARDPEDIGMSGVQINLSGPQVVPSKTTDSNGFTEFQKLQKGTYSVQLANLPPGYEILDRGPNNTNPIILNTPSQKTANFYVTPQHTISGRIFIDTNQNYTWDTQDTLFADPASPAQPQLNGSSIVSTTNGIFTIPNVPNGLHTLSLPTPSGYQLVVYTPQTLDFTTQTTPRTIDTIFLIAGYCVGDCPPPPCAPGNCQPPPPCVGVCDPPPPQCTGVCDPPPPTPPGAGNGALFLDYDDNNALNQPPDTRFAAPNGLSTPVALLNSSGVELRRVNSNAVNATYYFGGLKAGTYFVAPPLPNGYKQIRALDLPDPGNSARSRVTISNADITNLRFLVRGWTIEGQVTLDYNHNAANDLPEDQYYNGITLSLSGGYNTRPTVTTSTIPLKGVGYYRFTGLRGGPVGYTVTLNDTVAGFTADFPANNGNNTTTNPRSNIQLGNVDPWLAHFNMTPLYSISGNIFIDQDKNLFKGGDPNYTASQLTILIDGTAPTGRDSNGNPILRSVPLNLNTVTGAYDSGIILISGKYTVEHTTFPLPDGFLPTYPDAGRPYSFDVWIGTQTNSVGTPIPAATGYRCIDTLGPPKLHNDATCWQAPGTPFNGSIQNVNFGISDSIPWYQGQGGDIRADRGVSNPIPDPRAGDTPACVKKGNIITGSSTTAGVWFSGDSSWDFCASVNTCKDRANNNPPTPPNLNEWIVGGTGDTRAKYSSRINGALSTEYGVLLNTATSNNITVNNGIPGCGNPAAGCAIPNNLANGVYRIQGNMLLNASTLGRNHDYVFLIDGDLRIAGNVFVPVSSTAVFSSRNDILISSTVGQSADLAGSQTNCTIADPNNDSGNHPGCNVEGIYSANHNFVVEGSGKLGCQNIPATPRDRKINIAGVVIANALPSTSGGFSSQRDTCEDTLYCPVFTIKDRPDFVLNAPEFMKYKNYLWQEVAP